VTLACHLFGKVSLERRRNRDGRDPKFPFATFSPVHSRPSLSVRGDAVFMPYFWIAVHSASSSDARVNKPRTRLNRGGY
jgi:hypothetical protein